jgi:hypothetical protein
MITVMALNQVFDYLLLPQIFISALINYCNTSISTARCMEHSMPESSKIKLTDGFASFYALSCVVLCCVRRDS